MTSNPTIFQKAIIGSDHYARQIHDLAVRGIRVEEALRMITTFDVRWACDLLRPTHDATDGVDGRVSIEVAPASRKTASRPSPKPASCGGSSTAQPVHQDPGDDRRPAGHHQCRACTVHSCEHELWYVLDGEFRFLLGDALVHEPTGGLERVPRILNARCGRPSWCSIVMI